MIELIVTFKNKSTSSRIFPYAYEAYDYANNCVCLSSNTKVISIILNHDTSNSCRTIWQSDWDIISKREGLLRPL